MIKGIVGEQDCRRVRTGPFARRAVGRLLALLLISTLVVLCEFHPAQGAGKKRIKIGFLASLADHDPSSGKALLDGATLATDQINRQGGIRGSKLILIPEGEASDPVAAVKALRYLAEKEECVAVIGSTLSPVLMACMPIANEKQLPILAPSTASEITQPGNKWLFRIGPSNRLYAAGMASFAVRELKWQRIAILNENDELGTEGMKDFSRAIKKLGLSPISHATFERYEKDFTVQIAKILKKNPDGMVVWGFPTETALIAQQLRQMGYHGVIIGSPGLTDMLYIEISRQAGDNTVYASSLPAASRRPMVSRFQEDFQAHFGYAPSELAASGYDAIVLLSKAMLSAKSMDRKGIRDALSNLENQESVQGYYTFKRSHGNGLRSLSLLIYLNRRQILLQDPYHPDPQTFIP